jgi:hypothetical protein
MSLRLAQPACARAARLSPPPLAGKSSPIPYARQSHVHFVAIVRNRKPDSDIGGGWN